MLRAIALLVVTMTAITAALYWFGTPETGSTNRATAPEKGNVSGAADKSEPVRHDPERRKPASGEPEQAEWSRPSEEPDGKSRSAFETVRRDIRDVTPEGIIDLPGAQGDRIERLPAVVPPPPPPKPPEPVMWRNPVIENPGELVSQGTVIRLAGIEPLGADEHCNAGDGRTWPCGRFARTALRRLVRGRTLSCDPAALLEEETASRIVTRCRAGGHDLSQWLVEQGWARDSGDGLFSHEAQTARKAERGIWGKGRPR